MIGAAITGICGVLPLFFLKPIMAVPLLFMLIISGAAAIIEYVVMTYISNDCDWNGQITPILAGSSIYIVAGCIITFIACTVNMSSPYLM